MSGVDPIQRNAAKAVYIQSCHGYWGEHPDWPVRDWQEEVSNNYTREGYWDWVCDQIADHIPLEDEN